MWSSGCPKDLLFNLNVADFQKELDCPCYQYANDTTYFLHTKVADLGTCVNDMKRAISRLGKYSSDSNLALNEHKTKVDAVVHKANGTRA